MGLRFEEIKAVTNVAFKAKLNGLIYFNYQETLKESADSIKFCLN